MVAGIWSRVVTKDDALHGATTGTISPNPLAGLAELLTGRVELSREPMVKQYAFHPSVTG
jgi:hypothetical protein